MKTQYWLFLLVGVALVIWWARRQTATTTAAQTFTGTIADPAVVELQSSLAAVNKELERQTAAANASKP
jgi:hypothetical protein